MLSVYFSVPVSLDWNTQVSPKISDFIQGLCDWGIAFNVDVKFWKRGSSYNIDVSKMDALVILTPDNSFKTNIKKLPSGVQSEVKKAIENNVPIYLSYIPNSINAGIPQIYKTIIDTADGSINGISGTTIGIYDMLIGETIVSSSSNQVSKREHNVLSEYKNMKDVIKNASGKTINITTKVSFLDKRLLLKRK